MATNFRSALDRFFIEFTKARADFANNKYAAGGRLPDEEGMWSCSGCSRVSFTPAFDGWCRGECECCWNDPWRGAP